MSAPENSGHSVEKASQSTDTYSTHGDSQGAAGVIDTKAVSSQDMLDKSGESEVISPPEGGFDNIHVGLQWDNIIVEQSSGFMGLIKKATKQGIDLDLGCFVELTDGSRAILQPFGELFGSLNKMPFVKLSGDERTGNSKGDDESFEINGKQWPKIKRILIYTYIYEGECDWSKIKPYIHIDLKNNTAPIEIKPSLKTTKMTICALATIKNVKDGIQISTHGEYFTSQGAMDRAFGFGFEWEDGAKS